LLQAKDKHNAELTIYFVGSALLCALIPVVMSKYAAMFPDKDFSFKVDKL
jgi:AP-5 complex subunit zeta-1